MNDSWRSAPLSEVMTGNIIRILSGSTLHDAQELMAKSNLARLVVTDRAGKLRGIISRRDLVRFLSGDKSGRPLDSIPIREAMSTPVLTLPPTDTVAQSARTMNRKGIGSIIVTDDAGEMLGIVTKTDLCFHFSLSNSKERVKTYMTRKVFTVRPTHSIFFVASVLARQGISRVPVVNDKLRGIITLSDITRAASVMKPETRRSRDRSGFHGGFLVPNAKFTAVTASDIMTPKPITITSEELLSRAAELMIEHGISGLPVMDSKGRVQGILTKTDVIRAIAD